MVDEKLTNAIAGFLMKDKPTDAEIIAGAELLLRINRNRPLHQNIIRRPQRMLPKLQYELNKHLRYRKDGLTLQKVRDLQAEVFTETQKVLDEGEPEATTSIDSPDSPDTKEKEQKPKIRGKRPDHDSLPEDIKALWTVNAERWKKLKAIFETCKALDQPCDRYEHLLALKEGYEAYKVDMYEYDNYVPEETPTTETAEESAEPQSSQSSQSAESPNTEEVKTAEESAEAVTDNTKVIINARSYISKNKAKLEKLATTDTDESAKLRIKIQERVDTLKALNAAIDDDTKAWLLLNHFAL